MTDPIVNPLYKPTAPLVVAETDGIRRFTDANIQRAIDDALASVPEGKRLAVVAHADLEGVSLSAVAKLDGGWSIMAGAYKKWTGDMGAEAKVVWNPF